ncbi:MAG: 4-hydroxy-3-methylbut-2-enyl diphosphate reductase [Clostridiales bacterium]|jgi:4-hydroxy-3-methylbut-2-enyl diphosphate reductase|nr:4-hydroxy-3-methylbut-2-enyl diphosphate reductase [Clostridiales bacterium]
MIVAKNIGFCPGVRSAVERAAAVVETVQKEGGRVFLFGHIIHNTEVSERFEKRGARVIDNFSEIRRGDTVVIRAHGAPPAVFDELKERGAKIVDCTCPFVKKTQEIVIKMYKAGKKIIIAGEPEHPEVVGINGYAENKADIVGDGCDFSKYGDAPACLVFQTTFDNEKYEKIIEKIRKDGIKTLEVFNTICYTTSERQRETAEIAKKCSAVLVIGDKKSSNTNKLFEIAGKYCRKVFFISGISDLNKVDKDIFNMGIVTGASTSDELIMEVIFTMSDTRQSGETEATNVAADSNIESVVLNKTEENTAEKISAVADKKTSVKTANDAGSEAESKAQAAVKKALAAEKKAALAEKKAEEAEKKAREAELKALEAEKKAEEAEKKTDISEIKAKIAAEKKAAVQKVAEAIAPVAEESAPIAKSEEKPPRATVKKVQEENLTMADVMSSKNSGFTTYKAGKKVTAIVINSNENGVNVAIGGKKDGFIDKSEMNLDGSYDPSAYKKGDIIDAVIIENPNKDATYINLSKKKIDESKENDRVCAEILNGVEFELVCDKVVKSGITGRYGSYTVFVPASQIQFGYVKNLEEYLGKKLRLQVLPPKEKEVQGGEASAESTAKPRSGKFIVASQRVILEKEKREREDEFWNFMRVGEVVNGKVKRFVTFGAFVEVNGFDCLVHISDISWSRGADPAKVFELNGNYDFIVLKVDRENGKVSLGYKQLQRKPYDMASEKYPVGSIVTGTVERIKDFGAFVSLDDGVDGLVHVSQISHNWIKNANEALKVGDQITAKVMSFEDNKITLSIKELLEKPEYLYENREDFGGEDNSESREKRFKKREAGKREFKNDGSPEKPHSVTPYSSEKPKRDRRQKTDEGFEQSEWVSTSATTSLGDLFKNIKLDSQEE